MTITYGLKSLLAINCIVCTRFASGTGLATYTPQRASGGGAMQWLPRQYIHKLKATFSAFSSQSRCYDARSNPFESPAEELQ